MPTRAAACAIEGKRQFGNCCILRQLSTVVTLHPKARAILVVPPKAATTRLGRGSAFFAMRGTLLNSERPVNHLHYYFLKRVSDYRQRQP
jgi:hypothetical protein